MKTLASKAIIKACRDSKTLGWPAGAALLSAALLLLSIRSASATGFTDGFEHYAPGILDATYSGGPNEAGPGAANPWFAAAPAVGLRVLGQEYDVAPHSGTNMVRGHTYNGIYDASVNWLNLSFRCATGAVYYGNIALDWWFYDPLGSGGGGQYAEYVALCNYDGVPGDTDYYSWPAFGSQRLSLGAYVPGVGTEVAMYQARIVGAADAVDANGWFYLTNAARSIGWHHARIVIGSPNGVNTPASFYIDDMITPALTHVTTTDTGFNLLEINADLGNTTGYFDDFTFAENVVTPGIGTGPANQTVRTAGTATFSVSGVTGSPTPAYYWRKNGAALQNGGRFSGVNTATLTITGAVEGDAGTYSCVVSNIAGAAVGSATLSLIVPPTIDAQAPAGGTVYASQGGAINLSVTAHASNPITYRWQKGGVNLNDGGHISGAMTANLKITGFDASDAGSYSCYLSNADGSTNSAAVALALASAPTINIQPTNQTVAAGGTATFTVGAAGTGLSYQWSKGSTALTNNSRITGATSATLSIANVLSTDAGFYSCTITNNAGATNTVAVTLAVINAPVITTQPVSKVASNGSTIVFHVVATDTAPSYQWYKNGVALANGGGYSGVTMTDLTIQVTSIAAQGIYSVMVSNIAGHPMSDGAALRVNQAALSFFDNFESYSVAAPISYGRLGTPLDHNYGVNPPSTTPWWGSAPPNFFTFISGQDGANAYSGTQMIGGAYATVTSGDNDEGFLNLAYRFNGGQRYYGNVVLDWYFYDPGVGDYADQLSLANFGSNMPTNSDSSGYNMPGTPVQHLFLGAWPNLDITKYQASVLGASDGASGIISKNIVGTTKYFDTATPRSMGWHHARILVGPADPGTLAANARFYIDDMMTPTFAHDLPAGKVGFNSIHTLACTVFPPATSETAGFFDDVKFQAVNDPYIVEQPVSLTNAYQSAASFTVVAMGTGYQWQKDGLDLPGQTAVTLTLASVGARDQGTYTCIVTGANGAVSTVPATLTVTGAPPLLNAKVMGQNVVITWSGSYPLVTKTNLATGTWTTVPNATSPYTNTYPAGQRFFGLGQ